MLFVLEFLVRSVASNLSFLSRHAVGGKEQGLRGSWLKVVSLDAFSLLTFEFDLNVVVASPGCRCCNKYQLDKSGGRRSV